MPAYVAGDIRSIQDYIFGSPRLYEMRGASAIISFFDRAVVPRLVADHGGTVVSAGGGNFLAELAGAGEGGEPLVQAAENAFFDLTGGHEIVVERLVTEEPFELAVAELQRRIRRRKHAPAGAQALASMPFLKRCESCGQEAADVRWKLPRADADDLRRQWLGPTCDRKRVMHTALAEAQNRQALAMQGVFGIAGRLAVPHLHPRLAQAELPDDFETLVGDDDLATLVADGNDLGSWFAGRSRAAHEELARSISGAMETALDSAFVAAFPAGRKLPVQVLICGGDDLVVALPARYALDFTQALLAGFRVTDAQDGGKTTGLAAGLLLSKHTFPFRQAHALAEELMGRAKARCKEEALPSAVDLLRVTATQVQSLDRELAARERVGRNDSAWAYGAAGPYTEEELAALLALAGALRRQVSPSQRGRLREILSPREDGPETRLHGSWPVPARVVEELDAWSLRQEEEPFKLPLERNWERYVRAERRQTTTGTRLVHRWKLHDALVLAEAAGS